MTKLIVKVTKNYLNVLLKTIPQMISQTARTGRIAALCGVVLLYPLAFVVLLGLVAVTFIAVSVVRPYVSSGKAASAR